MISLTDSKKLRRPFDPLAVKFLPVGKIDARGYMSFLTYIDASLVIERLTDVDPSWTLRGYWEASTNEDPIGLQYGAVRRCELTVCGITREGHGQLTMREDWNTKKPIPPKQDDKHVKEAVSDAFKRAALMFEVGAYLRNMGDNFRIPQSKGGQDLWWGYEKNENGKKVQKFGGLNAAGKQELRRLYATIVNHKKFVERYGSPQAYGAIEIVELDDVPVIVNDETMMTPSELNVLLYLSSFGSRKQSDEYLTASWSEKSFTKVLPSVIASVKPVLGLLEADQVKQLRDIAKQAATDDDLEVLQNFVNQHTAGE
jgi:hypothetical protein